MTVIDHDFPQDMLRQADAEAATRTAKRKKLFALFAGGLLLTGGSAYGYETLVGAKHVVTDNAYVGADVAQVTPLVGGPAERPARAPPAPARRPAA
jgi:membrane fusion protein, multidrug efflux system